VLTYFFFHTYSGKILYFYFYYNTFTLIHNTWFVNFEYILNLTVIRSEQYITMCYISGRVEQLYIRYILNKNKNNNIKVKDYCTKIENFYLSIRLYSSQCWYSIWVLLIFVSHFITLVLN